MADDTPFDPGALPGDLEERIGVKYTLSPEQFCEQLLGVVRERKEADAQIRTIVVVMSSDNGIISMSNTKQVTEQMALFHTGFEMNYRKMLNLHKHISIANTQKHHEQRQLELHGKPDNVIDFFEIRNNSTPDTPEDDNDSPPPAAA